MSSTTWLITNIVLTLLLISLTFLNSLLLLVVFRQAKETNWTISLKLIVCIAATDITFGLLGGIDSIFQTFIGENALVELEWFCQLTGSFLTLLIIITTTFTSIMALNRYLILCKRKHLPEKIIWLILLPLLTFYCVAGIIAAIQYNFRPVGTRDFCFPSIKLGVSGKIFYSAIAFANIIFPTLFSFCYIMILNEFEKIAKEESRKMLTRESPSQSESSEGAFNNKDIKSLSGMLSRRVKIRAFIYLVLYVPCCIPNLVAIGWDLFHPDEERRPPLIDTMAIVSIIFALLANPIIVFLVHDAMLKDLKLIVKKALCIAR